MTGIGIDRVVVISDDAVESGGAAGIALLSVRLLAARGIPVTLLNGSDPWIREAPGVELHSLGQRTITQGSRIDAALRGLYSRPAERFVSEWIAAHDTPGTIYHLHNWHKVLSPSIFRALTRVAERLVMTAHDYFLVCPNGGQFDYATNQVCERVPLSPGCVATQCDRRHYAHKLWRVARHRVRQTTIDLARSSASIVAVHEGMIPYLTRGGVAADRITTVTNPVTPWSGESRIEAERNAGVLFVGRLEADKGVLIVARAARQAGVPLRIVGDGPLRSVLQNDHPEAAMLGWRTREEITEIARDARLVVVPTRWRETFGLVTLEALMSGLPVLVSRHALIAPDVVGLGCAELCDPDDAAGLAAALGRLSRDDDTVERMSRAGFDTARTLAPTPEVWCDGLIGVYQAKISDGRDFTRASRATGEVDGRSLHRNL